MGMVVAMRFSNLVLWLMGGCQNGFCGCHVVVKDDVAVAIWLLKRKLWLLCGCKRGYCGCQSGYCC